MTNMPNLRIALVQERPDQIHYGGGTITGNLLLDVAEPKSYKNISALFSGRSYVHWTESRSEGSGNHRRTRTVHYTSNENYVNMVAPLWNSQQSPDGKLPTGEYSWPFSFAIPPGVPSSFEGTVGNIRYSIVGQIVTGFLKSNHAVEVRIPVQQLVKISDPRLLQPLRQEVQKRLCCLCCASAPIILTATVPKSGFCIGESFQVHVSLENGSNRRVTVNAAIVQQVTYTAQGGRRWSTKTLVAVQSDAIERQATRNWDPSITIPAADIVHETSCSNIKVNYSLSITVQIPRALNLSAPFPLQLGNCQQEGQPLLQQGPVQQAPLQQGPLQQGPLQQGPPPPAAYPPPAGAYPPPAQPGVLPPAYQPPVNYPPPGVAPPYAAASPHQPPSAPDQGAAVGWVTQPMTDFPPPKPEDTLVDIPAPKT